MTDTPTEREERGWPSCVAARWCSEPCLRCRRVAPAAGSRSVSACSTGKAGPADRDAVAPGRLTVSCSRLVPRRQGEQPHARQSHAAMFCPVPVCVGRPDPRPEPSAHLPARTAAGTSCRYRSIAVSVLKMIPTQQDLHSTYRTWLNLLSHVPELRVIARHIVVFIQGQDVDVATIAEQLNVSHLLEGAYASREPGTNHGPAHPAIDSSHLCPNTYDRTEDIFAPGRDRRLRSCAN